MTRRHITLTGAAGNALLAQRRERTEAQKRYLATIDAAISHAGAMRERVTVETEDGAEAYAYPHPRGIAWGVNAAGSGVKHSSRRAAAGRKRRGRELMN
jgi:hypothetical protein